MLLNAMQLRILKQRRAVIEAVFGDNSVERPHGAA
jgi:hypothetical protein